MFENRTELERFLLVVEHGNMLTASKALGLTQPALSYTIATLEERLGAPLFERLQYGVRLTQLGRRAAERARSVLRELERSDEHLAALAAGRTGRLRITAGPAFLEALLSDAVLRFHEDHGDVELDVRPAGADVLHGIWTGGSDLYCGLLGRDPLPAGLRRESLPAMTAGIVARRHHPLHAREAGWEDLAACPWIDHGGLGALLEDVRRHAGRPVRRLVHAGEGGLLVMQTGPYLARLPLELIERLPGRFLSPLPVSLGRGEVRAALVSREGSGDHAALHRLRECVREAAAGLSRPA